MPAAGTALGPNKLLAPLGAGGMGEVCHARDPWLGRDAALKLIHAAVARDSDRIKRFGQEARGQRAELAVAPCWAKGVAIGTFVRSGDS